MQNIIAINVKTYAEQENINVVNCVVLLVTQEFLVNEIFF